MSKPARNIEPIREEKRRVMNPKVNVRQNRGSQCDKYCIPLGTPTLSLCVVAHLVFELGLLVDKILFAAPVIIAVLLVLVIRPSEGGCVGVNADNCRTMDV
jgi:hypothetical protein